MGVFYPLFWRDFTPFWGYFFEPTAVKPRGKTPFLWWVLIGATPRKGGGANPQRRQKKAQRAAPILSPYTPLFFRSRCPRARKRKRTAEPSRSPRSPSAPHPPTARSASAPREPPPRPAAAPLAGHTHPQRAPQARRGCAACAAPRAPRAGARELRRLRALIAIFYFAALIHSHKRA